MDYSNLITGKDSFIYNFRHGEIFHDPNVEKFLKTKSYNKIWFTSDLHLFKDTYKGEKSSNYYLNIMKKFTRIERKLISENGVFIYSGDILYRNAVEDDEYVNMVAMFIKQLKGTKILIRGNHDLFNHEYYTKSMGFDYVTDYVQYNNLFLTHAPYPLDPTDKNTVNIHGHIHGERKYMNMEPDRHYDVYAYNNNKYLYNLQDILSEMDKEDYSAGEFYLDPNWEYFEQAKKIYKDYKESGMYNTEQIVEEISKISGKSYVENLLIDNLIDNVENDDCNTVSLMDEYPYFIPDEMENLGVFSDNPEDNCYKVSHKDYLDDDDTIDSKTWYNEYKLFCKGIYTENFEKYFPLWKNKVRILCEKLKQNPSNEIKQSLLELGWNPEVEFTDSNRIRATKRVKSFIESKYDNSNIYNATNIDTDIDEDIVEEAYKEKLYPVYIVLSYTNTPFGRICVKVTKGKYSHSGIALDADLKRIYTFTGDAKHGFAIENLDVYSQNCADNLSKLGVYCIFVTKEDLKKIKIKLDYFLLNRYDFKYSYLGILTLLMNKDVHFNNAMICSQFVNFILKSADINLLGKADSLVQPDDYYNIKNKKIYLLYDGHIKGYDSKAIQKRVDKLSKTAYYINESSILLESNYDARKLVPNSSIEKNDLVLNFDQWQPDGENILYVTGPSGSGKSTLARSICENYNATYVDLDKIMIVLMNGISEEKLDRNLKKIKAHTIEIYKYYKLNKDKIKLNNWGDPKMADVMMDLNTYFNNNYKSNGKLYVLEGVQIYFGLASQYLVSKPIIIKRNSLTKAMIRRSFRDGKDKEGNFNFNKWLYTFSLLFTKEYRNTLKDFSNLKKRAEYYQNVNESSLITESSKSKHLYFYHLVPKGTKLNSNGITSLQYQYDNNQHDLFAKNSDKYRYRICNGWNVFPDKNPNELTDEDILYGLKRFRGDYGASYIYLFKYPPYKELGSKMNNLLKDKDIYRIDLYDTKVKNLIEEIDWGYYLSNNDNKKMTKKYYENVSPEEYFSKYTEDTNMIFAAMSHIAIKFKNNCIPKKLLTKVEVPNNITDISESSLIKEEKEFGIQFNDKGDLLIKNPKKVNLREEYFKSHEIIIEYNKANNIEGIKYELARLWYLNCLLESKLYGNKLSNTDKKEYTTVRAKVLNDFKKYMNVVHKYDKSFNFDMYYNETPFSDNKIKINNSTLKYSTEKIKNLLKLL